MATHAFRRWLVPIAAALVVLGFSPAAHAANIALGKPAFADINNDTAGNVNNGNYTDQWNDSGSPGAPIDFVGIDLGSPQPIKQMKIFWATAPTGFNIQVATTVDLDPNSFSYGEGDWVTVYSRTSSDPQPTGTDLIDLSSQGINKRYVRIYGQEGATWGIAEWEVSDITLPTLSGSAKYNGTGVARALISLSGPQGSPTAATLSTTADDNGAYSFAGLEAGDYTLRALAPGQYAPASTTVTVGTANLTKDVSFTTPVNNLTSRLPAYGLDFVATMDAPADSNTSAGALSLPADELPTGDAVWTTSTALPTGGTVGSSMPQTLKFYFPPTATGKNNVISAQGAILPLPKAHYTSVYVLQVGVDAPFYTTAVYHYADGTTAPVLTSSGSDTYAITTGSPGWGGGAPGEDEIVAFSVDKLYNGTNGSFNTENPPFNVFMRTLTPDPTKELTSIEFDGVLSGPGSNTLSKGVILGYSADTTDPVKAPGTVAGTVKAPNGTGVKSAQVTYLSYRITTDSSGAYKFYGVPEGTATITASKPANYAPKSINVNVTAGQDVTGADIQFTAPIPVVADQLTAPTTDAVSTDPNYSDFTNTGWMLGREYIPTGLYSPDNPGSNVESAATFSADPNAPRALAFNFGNITDPSIAPGQPGYPAGGKPNALILQGATLLAPKAKVTNVYFAVVGAEGSTNIQATLYYDDGTTEQKILAISDWFQSPSPNELPYLLMHGRHSRDGEANQGGNIRINALVLPVNANKQLTKVVFGEGSASNTFPTVLAVSWEVEQLPPASSDVQVTVKTATGGAAAGAIVLLGPYNLKADANGVATFYGVPAGLTVGLGAYQMGLSKQARQEGYVVPTGQKPATVTLTLPSGAPNFVQLPLAYNYDYIATSAMPGDYKTTVDGDVSFPGDAMTFTSNSTATVANIPFKTPFKETGYNNALRLNGQTIAVAPGHYSALDIAITGVGAGSGKIFPVTLHYDDGTDQVVQFATVDWVNDWANVDASNLNLFFRMVNPGASSPFYAPGRLGPGGMDGAQVTFMPETIPVDAGKVLKSFSFAPIMRLSRDDDATIIAATLEANDAPSMGSIPGNVKGQPCGATASGPLAAAQVVYDAGHAAYTDASGNYSIPSLPVGSGNLTAIPYGTGIFSKTVPVTVAAGTNPAVNFDLGAAQSQAYVVLGPSNTVKGLAQVEGLVTPYGYTYSQSKTNPVTLAGQTARQGGGDTRMFFTVDPGWLWHGRMGTCGLNDASLQTGSPVIAPHLYLQFDYYDNGTDPVRVDYNRMEVSGSTYTMTDPFAANVANMEPSITRTNTNTWKTAKIDLDPSKGFAFGAYKGLPLQSDMRIVGSNLALRNVVLSMTSTPVLPPTVADIIRAAGGLSAVTSATKPGLDTNADGKVDLRDAAKLLREQSGL